MKELHLNIASPEKTCFDGEVDSVSLPGANGAFTILPRHAPIVSALIKGTVSYVSEGETHTMEILDGFVEMNNENVSVCVECEND